ncbi:uncharacterized protein LOC133727528 isoform X2 [Rosa rugosa]|uniref:uncharacterized protein LOC133727528 isoform X2 n=1 Tax=Rosa rugosa TaxID=74645 RepID=UPI002B411F85|nr:uncharacterized protein LOC133727528 isoform X2 [Rosa rugosa]
MPSHWCKGIWSSDLRKNVHLVLKKCESPSPRSPPRTRPWPQWSSPISSSPPVQKEDILPNYDFQPIRPITGASSQSPSFDATPNLGGGGGSTRAWNSQESKSNTNTPIRNYGSVDSFKRSKDVVEKDRNVPDATIISEIDHTMKKYADNLLQVMEGISARLTQLESRTRHLENYVDDLKVSVGNNHGNADGKMRQMETILRDVQTGVQDLKDKQSIVEAQKPI